MHDDMMSLRQEGVDEAVEAVIQSRRRADYGGKDGGVFRRCGICSGKGSQMKLKLNGSVEFASKKEILDYIRLFASIESDRDVSTLSDLIEGTDLITLPVVREEYGGELSVEEGYMEEGYLGDLIVCLQEGCSEDFPPTTEDGIVLTTNVGGVSFEKRGRSGKWNAEQKKLVDALPDGFTEDELEEEFDASCNAQDVYDLISEALDEAVDVDEQFMLHYRLLRSVEQDIDTIMEQLEDMQFDLLYAEPYEYMTRGGVLKQGHSVYAWRKENAESDEYSPDEEEVKPLAVDIDTAVRYLAESVDWIEAPDVVKG